MNFLSSIKKSLGLDYRSLALFRVFFGFIIMADVLSRLPDLTNFYTDIGLIPRSLFVGEMAMPWSFSLHLANGSLPFAILMFSLHFLFGLMVAFGFKTRWALIGAYVMTASVHNRNWVVNNGGDDILRSLAFISIFLPLNKLFSVDSALTKNRDPLPSVHLSTWGWMYYLQIFVVYYIGYLLKDHPMWRRDFTAVYYSAHLDIFATDLSLWLRQSDLFLKASTIFTIGVEWLGPLLLVFSSVAGRYWWVLRSMVILLFLSLHIGIILTMNIGVFPYLCLVMWLIFIPGEVWDKFFGIFRKRGFGTLNLYYDGECLFCHKAVLLMKEFFLLPEVKITPAQDFPKVNTLLLKENSWVVSKAEGQNQFHYNGFLELMRHSPLLYPLVPLLGRSFIIKFCNGIYRWVASHRQQMSRLSQHLEFKSEKKEIPYLSYLYQLAGAFFFTTLLMWNLTTVKKWNIQANYFQNVARWFHLYQEWNMFAPFPKMDNVWIEIPALLDDGTQIELLTGSRDIYSNKEKEFNKLIPNEHWRKFYLNLSDRTDYARYYGGYLCRKWNERQERWVNDVGLRKFDINVYSEMNLLGHKKGGPVKKSTWKHWCYDEDYKRESSPQ
jgi:predicted DCC family thiol-disulfide oxidoreductase YuxK